MNNQNPQPSTTTDRSLFSDKEHLYVKDFMSWELLAMKKCKHSADSCSDPQIKALIEQIGNKHKQHYEMLLSQLQ